MKTQIIVALQFFETNMVSKEAKQDVLSLKYRLLGYNDVPRHKNDLEEIIERKKNAKAKE